METKNEIVVYGEEVNLITAKIKIHQDNVCQGMIEIGKLLIEAKKKVGHGNWLRYLDGELGYSTNTANKLIKVSEEFGESNLPTSVNLKSSQVIELLSLPQENRDDFIQSTPVEDITVKQLREEIKKYKEENGLIKEKADKEKKQLQSELKAEKSKPPVIKEVIVDKTDYAEINRLKDLVHRSEHEISNLREEIKIADRQINDKELLIKQYKADSKEYDALKRDIENLSRQKGEIAKALNNLSDIIPFIRIVEKFLKDVSPMGYSRALSECNADPVMYDNVMTSLNMLQSWVDDVMGVINGSNATVVSYSEVI
ncbi:MAG: DUF3102 domain-containing protein [Cellulosilyticaceae bacterium]